MDKATADKEGFVVGDTVTVLTQAGSEQFTISGIARFGNVDSPLGATLAVFDHAHGAAGPRPPGPVQRRRRRRRARHQPGGVGVSGSARSSLPATEAVTGKELTEEQQSQTREIVGSFSTFLLVFAVVALFVGCFLIYNTFSIIVAQRGREMALLRAIGASRRQVLSSVLIEALVTGLVASAVGVAVGMVVAIGLRGLLSAFGFGIPATGLTVEPNAVIIPIVVGVLITVASAFFPARKASKVPPVAAMRSVQIDESGRSVTRMIIGALILGLGILQLFIGLVSRPTTRC